MRVTSFRSCGWLGLAVVIFGLGTCWSLTAIAQKPPVDGLEKPSHKAKQDGQQKQKGQQKGQEKSASSTPHPHPDSIHRGLIETLEELRTAQGSVLDGTSLADAPALPADQDAPEVLDFGAALADVLRSETTPFKPPLRVDLPQPLPPPRSLASQREFYDAIAADGADDSALADMLREAGRLLDQKSHELERTQQYRHADRLRRLAQRMREEAREL